MRGAKPAWGMGGHPDTAFHKNFKFGLYGLEENKLYLQKRKFMQLALDDATWDLYLAPDGNIAVLKDTPVGPLLAQRIKHRLQTFRGECFLDREVGVPYFSEVLKKNPDLGRIRALLASVISGVEGVAKILSLEVLLDHATRQLTVNFRAQASDGTIAEGGL